MNELEAYRRIRALRLDRDHWRRRCTEQEEEMAGMFSDIAALQQEVEDLQAELAYEKRQMKLPLITEDAR